MAKLKDEVGNKYGKLTVISRAGTKNGYATWNCQCECGKIIEVKGLNLRRGGTKSCGCLKIEKIKDLNESKLIDLTNKQFGNLTVIKRVENKNNQPAWLCKCKCGSLIEVLGSNLRKNNGTFSCGCVSSKGEFKIAQLLTENNIPYIKEYKFEDCLSDKGAPLRFDFAILENEKVKYLIEYQGQQHYKENSFMGHDDFKARIGRDEIKKNYCNRHNYPLIIIPYTSYDKITINDLVLNTELK